MRKFTTILVAVVLCVAALAVVASAKNTNCTITGGTHDWSAWKTAQITAEGATIMKRTCACGAEDTDVIAAPHVHSIAYVPAAEACHVEGTVEFWYCTDPTCEAVFADEALTQLTNRKNLAIAPDCELAYVPAAEACHANGTAEYWFCPECDAVYADAEGTMLTNRKNLTIEADCELAYVPAAEACHANGTAEYWYCPECDAVYADAEGTMLTNRKNLTIEADCELAYVPAAEACHANGTAEYWFCPECEAVYADAEGTMLTNRKNLTIEADCELAYVPAAEACHVAGTVEYWYCPECEAVFADAEGTMLTNRKNLAIEADCELAYVPAAEACHKPGCAEYWYCPECEAVYADAEGTMLTNRKNLATEPVCELAYTAKVEPTATEDGMNEFWYCAGCDCYFTDAEGKMNIARLSLVIPALGEPEHVHNIAYVPAAEACHVPGTLEFWYCTDPTCEIVFADEALTQVTNRKNLATPAVVELVAYEAVTPCHANGYLAYWYCPKCDNYFADAAATQQTNIKNLTVEGDLSKLEYHAAVAATATENGMQEYWYCAGCDCFFTDAEGKYNIAYLSLTIPATGEPTEAPDAGDNAIFFIVALVAVATLGVAAVSFKKREN